MDCSKIMATWWAGVCYHKEQLDAIIGSTDVKHYAWILHDKDKLPDGTPKKTHYHFLVQFGRNQRGGWFKRFSSDDMGLVFPEPCYAPQGAFNYLIHDTPKAHKDGKHLYAPSERVTTIENMDGEADGKPDEHLELFADLTDLLDGKITWHEMLRRKPKRIHMIANIKVAYDLLCAERYGVKDDRASGNS